MELFEIFAKMRVPMTQSEIGRMLGAPSSSCFNLIRAMENRGYLYWVGKKKAVYPTRRIFDIASMIVEGEQIVRRVEPYLTRLRDATSETVIFGMRQGERVVYLAVVEGTQTIRYIAYAGDRKPLHSSSIGKVLLGCMAADELADTIAALSLDPITDRTITDGPALLAEIAQSVARGYACTQGENVPDVMAIARAVAIEGTQYAVAVAGPINRMNDHRDTHAAALIAACADLAAID